MRVDPVGAAFLGTPSFLPGVDRRTRCYVISHRTTSSKVEPEMHDIAVGDDIVGAFQSHLTGILGALLAAAGDKVTVGNRLGADKALLEIGVDDARGLRRLAAVGHGPSTGLLGPDGE